MRSEKAIIQKSLDIKILSINSIQLKFEWLIKTVIVYLVIKLKWITVVILELAHDVVPDS